MPIKKIQVIAGLLKYRSKLSEFVGVDNNKLSRIKSGIVFFYVPNLSEETKKIFDNFDKWIPVDIINRG